MPQLKSYRLGLHLDRYRYRHRHLDNTIVQWNKTNDNIKTILKYEYTILLASTITNITCSVMRVGWFLDDLIGCNTSEWYLRILKLIPNFEYTRKKEGCASKVCKIFHSLNVVAP